MLAAEGTFELPQTFGSNLAPVWWTYGMSL